METNIIIAGVLVLVLLIVAGVFIFRKKDNYIPVNEFGQPYFPHRMMYGRFNPYIRGYVALPPQQEQEDQGGQGGAGEPAFIDL
jgi:hypothetical protein